MRTVPYSSTHTLSKSAMVVGKQRPTVFLIAGFREGKPVFVDSNLIETDDRAMLLEAVLERVKTSPPSKKASKVMDQSDASVCMDCGSIMTRTGTCYTCLQCGSTGGCG